MVVAWGGFKGKVFTADNQADQIEGIGIHQEGAFVGSGRPDSIRKNIMALCQRNAEGKSGEPPVAFELLAFVGEHCRVGSEDDRQKRSEAAVRDRAFADEFREAAVVEAIFAGPGVHFSICADADIEPQAVHGGLVNVLRAG